MNSRGHLSMLACASGRLFADRIAGALQTIYGLEPELDLFTFKRSREVCFPNREIKTVIEENIRGDDVYVIQSMDDPLSPERSINDNLMALLGALDAASRSDAERVTAVVPQFPYARQERAKERECVSAHLIARCIEEAGARKVITIDIHSEAIEGFFLRATLENLHASRVIMEHLPPGISTERLVCVAPDVGSTDRARFYSKELGTAFAVVDKLRNYARVGEIVEMRLVGEVDGLDVLMIDDMIATGGTAVSALRKLKEEGARDIYLACTLPFFSGKAAERFDQAHQEGLFHTLIGTDAVMQRESFVREHPWYREVSVAPLFAQVMFNINRKRSVSELLR